MSLDEQAAASATRITTARYGRGELDGMPYPLASLVVSTGFAVAVF
jgi:hypothetical protein